VFKSTYSRRQADDLIGSGRVTVNGNPINSKGGFRVVPFTDKVELDGKVFRGWEEMNGFVRNNKKDPKSFQKTNKMTTDEKALEYFKYWKPKGIVCTTDRSVGSNIIDSIVSKGCSPKHRIYPVGRLDKDSSGVIILTSDGRLPNALLRGEFKKQKTYKVTVNKSLKMSDLRKLAEGVVITTVAQRDGNRSDPLTAKTLPCVVEQIEKDILLITIVEGRNRQIRKMLDALDYDVVRLHRIEFCGIKLKPLSRSGEWAKLSQDELRVISSSLNK